MNASMSEKLKTKSNNVCFTWSFAFASRNDLTFTRQTSTSKTLASKTFRADDCDLEFYLEIEEQGLEVCCDIQRNLWLKQVIAKPGTLGYFEVFINSFNCGIYPYEDKFIEKTRVLDAEGKVQSLIYHLINSHEKDNVIVVIWSPLKIPPLEERLSKALVDSVASMLENTEFSDVVVETRDGTRYPVHRAVLAARSPVFFAMLKDEFLEAKERCIKIMDYSPETVKNMLTYLYTSLPPTLTYGSAVELMKVSDKYNLKELKEVCVGFVLETINTSNAAELLLIADLYMEREMKEKVLRFFSVNRKSFSSPELFNSLLDYPVLLVEVINAVVKE